MELNTGEAYNITYSYTLPEPTSNYDVSVTNTQYTITGEKRKRNVVVNCNFGTVPYKQWTVPYSTVTCDGHSCSSVSSSEFNDFILPKKDVLRISLSGVPELDAEPGTYNITCTTSVSPPSSAKNYNIIITNNVLTIQPPEPVNTDGSYNPDDPPHGYDPESTK